MRKLSFTCLMCGLLITLPVFAQVENDPVEDRLRPGTTQDETQTTTDRVRQRRNVDRRVRGTDTAQAENADRSRTTQSTKALAAWLMTCNNTEIELSKFAVDRASHDEVKNFAKMIQQDHEKLQTKLQEFADDSNQNWDSSASSDDSQQPAATTERTRRRGTETTENNRQNRDQRNTDRPENSDRPITRRANRFPTDGSRMRNRMGRQDLLEQVGEQAAKNSLQMTKDLLEKKDGQNFDMGYIGHQMVAHIQMISTMKAMQNHASGEFAQFLEQGIEKTEQHLEKAKEIAGKIEDQENR